MKKDEDGDLLYEGRLKKEKDVKVTLLLPDKYEEHPETYTTVEIFIITERSNILCIIYSQKNIFINFNRSVLQVAFHSMHVHTCRTFSVVGLDPDSTNKIDSDCIYLNETIDAQDEDFKNIPTEASKSYQQKSLNRDGYE